MDQNTYRLLTSSMVLSLLAVIAGAFSIKGVPTVGQGIIAFAGFFFGTSAGLVFTIWAIKREWTPLKLLFLSVASMSLGTIAFFQNLNAVPINKDTFEAVSVICYSSGAVGGFGFMIFVLLGYRAYVRRRQP